MVKYCTAYANNGIIMNKYNTLEEARDEVDRYEKEDKEDGFYKPNSYIILKIWEEKEHE